jgi:FkbM family methyltransferase
MLPGMDFSAIRWQFGRTVRCVALEPLLRRTAPLRTVQLGSYKLRVDLRDRVIAWALYVEGDFEGHVRRLLECLDLEGGVVVDVGANIGIYTLPLAGMVGPRGRVLAFEPEAAAFAQLEHNARVNGLAQIEPVQRALGDVEAEMTLYCSPTNFGDHRLHSHGDVEVRQRVRVVTLDAELAGVADGAVRLIKVDVQGHEPFVLAGMAETLRRNPDLVVLVEVGPELLRSAGSSATEFVTFLRDLEMEAWEVSPIRVTPMAEPWTYEYFHGDRQVDIALCRNAPLLHRALERYIGKTIEGRSGDSASKHL